MISKTRKRIVWGLFSIATAFLVLCVLLMGLIAGMYQDPALFLAGLIFTIGVGTVIIALYVMARHIVGLPELRR